MKLSKKKIIIATTGFLFAGILAIISALIITSKTTVKILFFEVPGEEEEILKNLISDSKNKSDFEFKFIEAKDNDGIINQAEKADIIFAPMGLAADKAVESIQPEKMENVFFDSSFIGGSSMSAASFALKSKNSGNGKISQVPLYFDGYEMLISLQALNEAGVQRISTWRDAEELAAKSKSAASGIAFAGGDADDLLAVISILVESFDGKEKYDELILKMRSHEGSMEKLFEKLYEKDEGFHDAINRIVSWKNKGIFNIEFLSKDRNDLLEIIERYKSSIIIMPLSEHRKISSETARYLTTLPVHSNETNFYFPSMRPLNTRSAMTPSVAIISMTTKKKAKDAVKFLTENEAQKKIAFKTGLAPFLANSKIPDVQSDDLRFWIAATSSPSVPMGPAAFDDKNSKEEFAESIRNWIRK